jgi:hypothetical protein
MTIGPFTVLHHTETTSAFSYVVFVTRTMQRAANIGKRGGFKTWEAAVEAATKQAKYGTQNV